MAVDAEPPGMTRNRRRLTRGRRDWRQQAADNDAGGEGDGLKGSVPDGPVQSLLKQGRQPADNALQ